MSEQLRIALYMRLSKEDEEIKEESGSIRMQRLLLHKFVEENFDNYSLSEFQDDGYSGTNFNRPGITQLLDLVKESALDCIIVKDFSRFSRDYIEMGSYIEQIFPFMGIRFISVNDHYDSAQCGDRTGEIDISFRNLLYDLYSRDLSVKVKSSLAARREKGNYISTYCPFGYEKEPNHKHMLVIAEDEADIVRHIFDMAISGMTSMQIAKSFNMEGIKTPIEFKIAKGKSSRKPKGKEFSWTGPMVCHILGNEIYMGDMVYGEKKGHIRPKSEWKVFHNHHAPIVSREVFVEAQRKPDGRKPWGTGKRHPLTGKLVCGCCGKSLCFCNRLNPYYCCPGLYVNLQEGCVRSVNVMFLEQYVLYEMQQRVTALADKDRMWTERREGLEKRLEELKEKRKSVQFGLKSLQAEKLKSYEQYAAGKKAEEGKAYAEYKERTYGIETREKETGAQLQEIEKAIESVEGELSKKQDMAELLSYFNLSELTQEAVQRFIRKIIVTDEQHLEISWNL